MGSAEGRAGVYSSGSPGRARYRTGGRAAQATNSAARQIARTSPRSLYRTRSNQPARSRAGRWRDGTAPARDPSACPPSSGGDGRPTGEGDDGRTPAPEPAVSLGPLVATDVGWRSRPGRSVAPPVPAGRPPASPFDFRFDIDCPRVGAGGRAAYGGRASLMVCTGTVSTASVRDDRSGMIAEGDLAYLPAGAMSCAGPVQPCRPHDRRRLSTRPSVPRREAVAQARTVGRSRVALPPSDDPGVRCRGKKLLTTSAISSLMGAPDRMTSTIVIEVWV